MNTDSDIAEATRAADLSHAPAGVRWIWFDLDDTLYDFASSSLVALDHVYRKYRLDRYFGDLQEWIDVYHRHNAALWELYNAAQITQQKLRFDRFYLPLQEGGAPDEENRRLNPLLDEDYLDALGSTGMVIEGAVEAVAHLKARGYKIGILSNGFRGVQHRKLQSSGLAPYVDRVVLSDDINVNKPDPRIYKYALEQSTATAAETLMIGDNPDTDIYGALQAGWQAILFSGHAEEDTATIRGQRVAVLHDLTALLNW